MGNIVRSSFLFLNSGFSQLRGVGEYFESCLKNLSLGEKIFDLLLVFPRGAKRVLFCPRISEVGSEVMVVLKMRVESHFEPKRKSQPHKFVCFNDSGYVELVFFKIYPNQIKILEPGKEIAVMGNLKRDNLNQAQIVHPEFLLEGHRIDEIPKSDLVYPLSGNLTQKFVRSKISEIFRVLDRNYDEEKARNNDWIDKNLLEKRQWPLFLDGLKAVHNFGGEYEEDEFKSDNLEIRDGVVSEEKLADILQKENGEFVKKDIVFRSRERLKYDEFLAWQIAMNFVRIKQQKIKEIPELFHDLSQEFLEKIPFELTNAQKKSMEEIRQNVLSDKTMSRLLQGDVGSGKTLVAIYGCLLAVSAYKQACVIVPISILADQHFKYFNDLLGDFEIEKEGKKRKIKIEILSGKTRKKKREKILGELKNGEIDILISTHAVIQPDVEFKNLSFVVIDEQHRFGVKQRLALIEKGKDIDVLLMSATPIPRSLMMAMYGDMDVSILDEKPKGRLEIETLVMSEKKSQSVYDGVKRAMKRGEKVYWICPLIEKNEEEEIEEIKVEEKKELVAAKDKFEELKKVFGEEKVRLIHGKMKENEKEKTMKNFKDGDESSKDFPQILVATTVIEVGVDVKDATVIVIENAENFGLSQLHQLRGRVGRSDKKSYCILLYGKRFGQKAKERLDIMRQSNDGFFIAAQDLKLRGSGELIGTKQSGELGFRVANLDSDVDLLKIASQNAKVILSEDPTLSEKKSLKYHGLLKLFSYDECIDLVKV